MRRLARRWAIAVVCFAIVALAFTSQVWIDFAYAGRKLSWGRAFAIALAGWEPWALIAPFVVALAERFPFRRDRWGRALAVHGVAAPIAAGAALAADGLLTAAIAGRGRVPFSFLKIDLAILTYAAIVGATHAVEQYRTARERKLRATELEAELARAQLETLKMQLQPHFLFNTLNTISGLMREDVEAADVMLAQLSELLRHTFDTTHAQEVPLGEEMAFLSSYLAIQQTRYGDRLHLNVDVPDAARGLLVPALVLQPLVENAIRHGFGARPGTGFVTITARAHGDCLHIEIVDDGPGPPSPVRDRYGLKNTRSRLRALYGDRASLALQRAPGGGAIVTLDLPVRAGSAS